VLDQKSIVSVKDQSAATGSPSGLGAGEQRRVLGRRGLALAAWALLLVVAFFKPLQELATQAAHSELYSHILLMPFVTGYLIWIQRRTLAFDPEPARGWAAAPLLAGTLLIAGYWLGLQSGWQPKRWDYLAIMSLALVCFVVAGGLLFFGRRTVQQLALPVALLAFTVPFPEQVRTGIEHFFQYGSAEVAYWFLSWSGMPILRQDTTHFQLPGIPNMEVAPECSGIHSSLVLFITSLVAGYLFLRSPGRRLALAAAVIPLAFLRNGLRIFTIGQLGVHWGQWVFDSPIHRRAGPIFFALSLIPFFLLLVLLRRSESKRKACGPDGNLEKA
jgi:exosortase C (VPDSG-CTERM-specific)